MPPEKIEELFQTREEGRAASSLRHPEECCSEKLFHDTMQCSHVGMTSSGAEEIGCLLYDAADRGPGIESFIQGTCKNFYCQAWDYLTDREVLFAAQLMRDWYYFSLFINDIEAVQTVFAQYIHPEDVPSDELASLKSDLIARLIDEDGK